MRPWQAWIIFALFAAVLLGAMGWTSSAVLRLERTQNEIARQADLEERVRLALWRMESAMAPLIARESARPYYVYTDYYPLEQPPAADPDGPQAAWESLLPWPMKSDSSPHIQLYFQMAADGSITSPQAPAGLTSASLAGRFSDARLAVIRYRLDELKRTVKFEELNGRLSFDDALKVKFGTGVDRWARLPRRQESGYQGALNKAEFQKREQMNFNNALANNLTLSEGGVATRAKGSADLQAQNAPAAPGAPGMGGPPAVAEARSQPAAANRQLGIAVMQQAAPAPAAAPPQPLAAAAAQTQVMPARQSFQIGLPKPVWMGGKLLLARRATVGGQVFLQGCWLDFDVVSRMLLDEVRDLLPEARVEPVLQAAPSGPRDRMMAALPVRLVPGALHPAGGKIPSPLRASLAVAWACVAVALVAIAALLAGALALGERRRTFVSAVTHELRTPLTTFRMYTEMLAGGMVPDEKKRTRYLETLRAEADRLTHLVENVLAYARLEAGRPGGRSELVELGELLERTRERLGDRARQACMELAVELPDGEWDAATRLRLDPTAVEQILLNLVDNACKYGAAAGERLIRIEARRRTGEVELRVSDRGPGVAPEDARKLFRPFSRSARDAAGSAPGVGLGLALSRRLARAMGGDLKLDADYRDGACFVFTLPVR